MSKTFSRRGFVKGGFIVAVGLIGGQGVAGCADRALVATGTAPAAAGADAAAAAPKATGVGLHRGYGAAHGEKCFTQAVVAVDDGGRIVAAHVDEYQFTAADTAGIVPVPNSAEGFSAGMKEGVVLMSKRENNDAYSAMIIAKAGATNTWADNMAAIEAYAVGKTPEELASVDVDAVSGSTLMDTANYLRVIGEVAVDDTLVAEGTYSGDAAELRIGRANYNCHGPKAFADAVALVEGDVIVAASIDEFQFFALAADTVYVPNSDKAFGLDNYAEGQVLASKASNSESYSKMMAEKVGSTVTWANNVAAIEDAIAGQQITEASGIDAVSGATLVDTPNYVDAAVAAAQLA